MADTRQGRLKELASGATLGAEDRLWVVKDRVGALLRKADLVTALAADGTFTLGTLTADLSRDTAWRHFTLATTEPRTAGLLLRKSHAGSHADAAVYSLAVETRPVGSGKNGPASADVGQGISVIKQGFGGATRPAAGELDGLYIVIRQDGPQGLPSSDPGSSDAAGILVDAQTVGDAGFISILDAGASQIDATTFAFLRRMQVQAGVIIANAAGAPVAYGYTAVAKTGVLDHAFYAGESGGTWNNILKAPSKLTIDSAGGYHIQTADWPVYAARFARTSGVNDALNITQRGTGGIQITAVEAAVINFATTNTNRWRIAANGTLHPITNLGVNLGTSALRVQDVFASKLDLGTTSSDGVVVQRGSGSPEGVVTANVGSVYLRTDGSAGTTIYTKASGTGNTGWAALPIALDDLSDVVIASAAKAQVLAHDGTDWDNRTMVIEKMANFYTGLTPSGAIQSIDFEQAFVTGATSVQRTKRWQAIPRAGRIIGARLLCDKECTAGTATLEVIINSTAATLFSGNCVIQSTRSTGTGFVKDTDTAAYQTDYAGGHALAAGDDLGLRVTVDAAYALGGSGGNAYFAAEVLIQYDPY